jgi:hypothetical protein
LSAQCLHHSEAAEGGVDLQKKVKKKKKIQNLISISRGWRRRTAEKEYIGTHVSRRCLDHSKAAGGHVDLPKRYRNAHKCDHLQAIPQQD